jgi:acyl carrier protein
MLDRPERIALDRVLNLVADILAANSIVRTVSIDDELIGIGLTSVDMVNLMLAVEAEFDIMIPQRDITPENFRSVGTIEKLVSKVAGTASSA